MSLPFISGDSDFHWGPLRLWMWFWKLLKGAIDLFNQWREVNFLLCIQTIFLWRAAGSHCAPPGNQILQQNISLTLSRTFSATEESGEANQALVSLCLPVNRCLQCTTPPTLLVAQPRMNYTRLITSHLTTVQTFLSTVVIEFGVCLHLADIYDVQSPTGWTLAAVCSASATPTGSVSVFFFLVFFFVFNLSLDCYDTGARD